MSSEGKIVICGGTGFVGQELGIELVRRGYSVTVLTRNPERYLRKMAFPCALTKFSRENLKDVTQAIDGAAAVINLAGAAVDSGTWNYAGVNSVYGSRVESAILLVEALGAATSRPQVFIQASGVGYYGKQKNPCNESAPAGTTYLAKVAHDLERESAKSETLGLRHVALRLGVVLGHGGALDEINLLYAAGIGSSFWGAANFPLPWIHIDDVVSLIITAVRDREYAGPVNAVAPDLASLADLHQAMSREQGRQLTPPVPSWGMRLVMKKRAALLFDNSPVVPAYLLRSGFQFRHPDIGSAVGAYFNRAADSQFRLIRSQFVQADMNEVWAFFSQPQNLEDITPPWLQFHIKKVSDSQMRAGTEITYQLKLKGIPFSWESVISSSVPAESFVDEQVKGPYKTWHHTHRFESLGDGVLITDDVSWRLPVGRPGALAAGALVRKDVNAIFSYRADAIARIFSGTGGHHHRNLLSSAKDIQATALTQW